MNRRQFFKHSLASLTLLAGTSLITARVMGGEKTMENNIEKIVKKDEDWKKILTPEQYRVLREEGTERAGTSPLNQEKRKGVYVCVACDHPLFSSDMKYDSGTGWPSFFTTLPDAFETKTDFKLIYPRTEYHCARCGGHHGHVFKDGPKPTGQRWCNNGVALKFIPDQA